VGSGVILVAALVGAVVVVGACIQGTIGFGLGLVAVPFIAIVQPSLLPGPVLVAGASLAVLVAVRDRAEFDLHGVRWALLGRVGGNIAGAALVASMPTSGLRIACAAVVLAAVGLSISGWRVAPTRVSLLAAGAASGVMGTATSIGGPPMALVYQDSSGRRLRGSLSGFFVVGSLISIATLASFGELGWPEVLAGAALLPPTAVGFALSRHIARVVDRGHVRSAVWIASATSSTVVLAIELWP